MLSVKPTVRTLISDDVIDHADGFDDWVENRYLQLGRSREAKFRGYLTDFHSSNVHIIREVLATPYIEQVGRVDPDKVVVINVCSDGGSFLNGQLVSSNTFHISSGKQIHALAKNPAKSYVLSFDRRFFFEEVVQGAAWTNAYHSFERFVSLGAGRLEFFSELMGSYFQASETRDAKVPLEPNLNQSLRFIFDPNADDNMSGCSSTTRAYIVERCSEMLIKNISNESFGVLDMCESLRISRRTLQYSFESIIGMSPLKYIRAVRLNLARHLIKCSSEDKVQNAALDAGFNHLGRFSKYYYDFFGELPSHTVSKRACSQSMEVAAVQ